MHVWETPYPAWLVVRLQAARMAKSFRYVLRQEWLTRNSAGYADTAVRAVSASDATGYESCAARLGRPELRTTPFRGYYD
jgi:hypothetical protein